MTVGDNIRYLRREAGLKQVQLAEMVGVARSTITQWERGWSSPRMGMVQKLAAALDVSTSDIVADGISTSIGSNALIPLEMLKQIDNEHAPENVADTQMIEVPASLLQNHPSARAIVMESHFMDRVIPEGFATVFDPDLEPTNGQVVIVKPEGRDPIIRRWYQGESTIMLVSDSHTKHEDIILSSDAPIRLLGTVIHVQSIRQL